MILVMLPATFMGRYPFVARLYATKVVTIFARLTCMSSWKYVSGLYTQFFYKLKGHWRVLTRMWSMWQNFQLCRYVDVKALRFMDFLCKRILPNYSMGATWHCCALGWECPPKKIMSLSDYLRQNAMSFFNCPWFMVVETIAPTIKFETLITSCLVMFWMPLISKNPEKLEGDKLVWPHWKI